MNARHLCTAMLAGLLTLSSQAQTFYVNASNTSPAPPYSSWSSAATNIQDAVNAAVGHGGTILVTNGIYQAGGDNLNGSNRVGVVAANLIIQSVNGPGVTTIMGYQVPGTTNGNNAMRGVFLASGSVLSGFTVTSGATFTGGFGGGIYGNGPGSIVTNCVISGNAAWDNAGGVYNATVVNCIITGNTAFQYGGGGEQCQIYNCIISSNRAALGGGGCYNNSQLNHCLVTGNLGSPGAGIDQAVAYDCLFTGNGSTNTSLNVAGGAAAFSTLVNCTVSGNSSHSLGALNDCGAANCIVYYNINGIYADCYQCQLTNCCTPIGNGTSTLPANSFSNAPGFINLAAGNYQLQIGSPCIATGNATVDTNTTDLAGNPRTENGFIDMGAYESDYTNTVLYVSLGSANPVAPYTNWLTAATNLEAAISVAQPGNVVAAGPGIYTNDNVVVYGSETNHVVVTNGVILVAVDGPSNTMIFGGTQTRCAYVDATSVLDGFTITNGHGSLSGDLTNEQSGGGIWCQTGGAVINCLIEDNMVGNQGTYVTTHLGGGVYGGTISNCTLFANIAGAGGGAENATLWNCLMSSNVANSGGSAYRCALYNCVASNNAAVYNGSFGAGSGFNQCVAYNCVMMDNTNIITVSVDGGGSYQGTNFNCTISDNAASVGGGTYQSTNINCFISGNVSSQGGGCYEGALYNCVVNGNVATNNGSGGGTYQSLLVNCTVTGNSTGPSGTGGGVYNGNAYNSIIYFNTGGSGSSSNWTGLSYRYCCTMPEAAPNTDGNITNNPLFVDASGGDFQLACGSPGIDAGASNNITLATTNDIRGMPRPLSGIDLGAYEYNPATDETTAIRPVFNYNSISTSFPLSFVAQISGCPEYYWWNFGDGTIVSNLPTVTHAWSAPGSYAVTLNGYYADIRQETSIPVSVQVVPQPVYYVKAGNNNSAMSPYTNWTTAASSIQTAISAGSTPGRLVLVTNGNYANTEVLVDGFSEEVVALTNGVFVESVNGPLTTSISQPGTGRVAYVGTNSFLGGFEITGAHTASSGNTNLDESGAGIYSEITGVISNCIITGNQANYNGSGGFQGTYYDCIFSNNFGGNSRGQGIGVDAATLYNCLIISNYALNTSYGDGACLSTLYNCIVTGNGNHNDFGGGAAMSTLYDCLVSGNYCSQGGGGYNSTFYNCTVAENTSTGEGGGLNGGAATNSIVYDNTGDPNTSNSNWVSAVFGWSCTAPLQGGTGNTSTDPAFVNPAGGNFQLQPVSPGINSGNNAFVLTATDVNGNPRITGGTVDMGAYEFQSQVTGTFNAWLAQYGLPTDGSVNNVDSDGTGMVNWQKWIAGLNPTNAASVLAMETPVATNNTAGVMVSWQSVTNRVYFINRSTNLTSTPVFSTIQNNIQGQNGTTTYTDTTANGAGPYFYEVGVQ